MNQAQQLNISNTDLNHIVRTAFSQKLDNALCDAIDIKQVKISNVKICKRSN